MEKKPDFEKLAEERYVIDETYTKKGADIQHDKRLAYFQGCHRIWTDYVTPLQSQLSEAEKRITELEKLSADDDHTILTLEDQLKQSQSQNERIDKEANHWMNQCLDKCAKLDKALSENERLLSALKEREEALSFMVGLSNTWGREWFSNATWKKIEKCKQLLINDSGER